MEGTVFAPSLETINNVKSEEGEILTRPFLDVCKNILPAIDNFGSAMCFVKSDVGGNISRLESKYLSNPTEFKLLRSIVEEEVDSKTVKHSSSCTIALLWLTRSIDFLVQLFRNLLKHPEWSMSRACAESYTKTLKRYHGLLAISSFGVAIKLAPDRKKFTEVMGGRGDLNSDMEKFCHACSPLLEQNHKLLASVGMDNLKS